MVQRALVSAAEISTISLPATQVDATAVADGGNIDIDLTIDKWPEGKVVGVQVWFEFDTAKMTLASARNTMKQYSLSDKEISGMRASKKTGADNVLLYTGGADTPLNAESIANANAKRPDFVH